MTDDKKGNDKRCKCSQKAYGSLVPLDEAKRFIKDCMTTVGASEDNAVLVANLLTEADDRGLYSHGMNRLEYYVNDVKSGLTDGVATPEILNETPATAWVDGKSALGPVVGNFCMDLAVQKAQNSGIGLVVAKDSCHYGIAAFYTIQAANEGMIGFSCTNTYPLMCPFGAKEVVLGSNPISFAAKAKQGDRFILDMATTAAAVGKIEMKRREGKPIPAEWCQDQSGNPIKDAAKALSEGMLLPLGGDVGYKGFGLALMVEVLCGILAGANVGSKIPVWGKTEEKANLGQFFMAIDPSCFAPDFEGRLKEFLDSLRNLAPMKKDQPVLIPGDPEKASAEKVEKEGGVRYVYDQILACEKLAKELGVKPLEISKTKKKEKSNEELES